MHPLAIEGDVLMVRDGSGQDLLHHTHHPEIASDPLKSPNGETIVGNATPGYRRCLVVASPQRELRFCERKALLRWNAQ